MSIINIEKEKGIVELSGSNNSKYTKEKELSKYTSASRTMLRIVNFIIFVIAILDVVYGFFGLHV